MICFNGSDLISLKANNGLLQPRLQYDDDDDYSLCDMLFGESHLKLASYLTYKESAYTAITCHTK